VASAGMAVTLAGLLMLAFLDTGSSVTFVVICLVVLGFGFALFSSPNTNAIMSSVDRRHFGVAGAMVSAMRQVGMMFSMGIVMMILALLLGEQSLAVDDGVPFLRAARIAFAVFAALCVGGIFASLARGKMHAPRPRE